MWPPVRVTAPAALPVTLADVKRHLRVTHDDDDALITTAIEAAVDYLDGYDGILGRCLVQQEWRQDFDRFAREMRLPFEASAIGSITWRNAAGQLATVASADYALHTDALGSYVRFKDTVSLASDLYEIAAVSVTFTTGYGVVPPEGSTDPNPIPGPIRSAIMIDVELRHDRPTGDYFTALKSEYNDLIGPFRRWGF